MQQRLTQLKTLYTDYIRQCRDAAAKAPPLAGLLSPAKDPRHHPRHDAFYAAVGELIAQSAGEEGCQESEMIRWMLEAPYFYANEDACWYLLAVQQHVKLLIPGLDSAARQELGSWFSRLVPKRHRLPAQEEILALLFA